MINVILGLRNSIHIGKNVFKSELDLPLHRPLLSILHVTFNRNIPNIQAQHELLWQKCFCFNKRVYSSKRADVKAYKKRVNMGIEPF